MKVKNNYQNCITNVACSIRKYFNLDYTHNTIPEIDKLLEQEKPESIVVILLDGMGSKIIKRNLPNNSFFLKNMKKEITTVFPATTTAATTSIRTGLNPCEHGWLGWNTYIKPINKVITLFKNSEKGQNEISQEFLSVKEKLVTKTIVDEINEKGNFTAEELFPFGENAYRDLDDMLKRIEKKVREPGKKYIYAYDEEPDATMHDYGPDSKEAIGKIKERNKKIEKLCKKLKNTVVIIIADHGHLKVEHLYLKNYPKLKDMLERTISLEQRAISFKIKENKQKEFEKEFNKSLGEYFKLYSKEEVLKNSLFGTGSKNELFEDALGDYIAIANDENNSNKCLIDEGDDVLVSQHAGYSDDEIFIPLIIVS